jgi:hypothetical protein
VWATEERFVTDWQLHAEPLPSSRFPFAREDSNEDEDWDDEDFGEEDDPDGEGVGEEDLFQAAEKRPPDDDFDALYVDTGGEA